MSKAGNFLITSEYPTDKIVWMYEGSVTTDEFGAFEAKISHNLPSIPFCTGLWTVDGWATQYNACTTIHQGQVYSRYSQLSSNNTIVTFSGYCSNDDGTAMAGATVRFRLWGFFNESQTMGVFADTTSGLSENMFVKNTSFGYPKLFMEGIADATQETQTIYHNLGFIPFVEIWQELDDSWFLVDYVDFTDEDSGASWTIHNTASYISFNGSSYTNYKYYYRIYADE